MCMESILRYVALLRKYLREKFAFQQLSDIPIKKNVKLLFNNSTDAWCPIYQRKFKTNIDPPEWPTMANENCAAANTSCVPMTQCPTLMNSPVTPLTVAPCSFDEDATILKICCPNDQGS